MTYPLVGICGKAGVGKDTVAAMLADQGGVCIAQADPLKRFGKRVFEFTETQLWGPSECRNALDPRDFDEVRVRARERLMRTAAEWLYDIGLENDRKQALLTWFSDELEYTAKNGLTPRHVLQTLGTEFGRRQKDSVWVDYAQRTAQDLLTGNSGYHREVGAVVRMGEERGKSTNFVIITDVRFRNEVLAIKRAGGTVIKVMGPNPVALAGDAGKHASETEQDGIPAAWFDAVIYNDKSKGFEVLKDTVGVFATNQLLANPPIYTPFGEVAT